MLFRGVARATTHMNEPREETCRYVQVPDGYINPRTKIQYIRAYQTFVVDTAFILNFSKTKSIFSKYREYLLHMVAVQWVGVFIFIFISPIG